MKVAFTGHRPQSLPWGFFDVGKGKWHQLLMTLKSLLIETASKKGNNENWVISGMAVGVDLVAALAAIQLQEEGYPIKLWAAVPCEGQTARWRVPSSVELYNKLLAKADKVDVLAKEYTARCMQERNEYMVNNADVLIAVWDGRPGGTGNTVEYARRRQVPIIRITP